MERATLKQALEGLPTYLNIKGLTKSTSEAYIGDLKIFKKYMDDNYPSITYVDTIRNFHIISYRNFLVEKIETKEYKRNTVDRKYDSLKVFFDFLEEMKSIKENFVKKFTFQRVRHITFTEAKEIIIPRYLSQDEIKKIMECVKKDRTKNKLRDLAILEILRSTGCRRSSIFDLEWKDIDFQEKEIIIKHRKGKKWSKLPLNHVLEQVLIDYHSSLEQYTSNVFNIKKDAFTNMVNKYVKKSGLQEKKDFDITAHTFRHSFITFLVKEGVPLKKIAEFTGHKDIRSLEIYTHLDVSDLKPVSNLFT